MDRIGELLASAKVAAFAIDRVQRFVFWNEAAEQIFDYPAGETLSRYCYEVIGGTIDSGCTLCHRHCETILKSRRHESAPRMEVRTQAKDGRVIWLNLSTILVPSSWHELSVLVHLIHDVTLRKDIEAAVTKLHGQIGRLSPGREAWGTDSSLPRSASGMTAREKEVLRALATGATTTELAARLFITEATTRHHIHNILSKLGVRNRLEAVTLALRNGLL